MKSHQQNMCSGKSTTTWHKFMKEKGNLQKQCPKVDRIPIQTTITKVRYSTRSWGRDITHMNVHCSHIGFLLRKNPCPITHPLKRWVSRQGLVVPFKDICRRAQSLWKMQRRMSCKHGITLVIERAWPTAKCSLHQGLQARITLDQLLIVFVEHTLWKLQGMPPAMETNQWWLTAQQKKRARKGTLRCLAIAQQRFE